MTIRAMRLTGLHEGDEELQERKVQLQSCCQCGTLLRSHQRQRLEQNAQEAADLAFSIS